MDRHLRFHTFTWSSKDQEYKHNASANDVLTLEGGPEFSHWQVLRNRHNPSVGGMMAPKGFMMNRTHLGELRGAKMDRHAAEYAQMDDAQLDGAI